MVGGKRNLLTALFVLIITGAVSAYIFNDLRKSAVNNLQPAVENTQTELTSLGGGTSGGYKVTLLPDKKPKTPSVSAKIPDLSLPITNYSHLDEAAFKAVSQNIAEITKSLKNDPNKELEWLNLSVYRKMLGDYEAAVSVLNYITTSWPSDYAPYNNLADLYQFYIKSYPLAEKNWLKVIELKPDYLQAYENLYGLYKDLYKEKQAQTLPILLKGLSVNPKSIDLMVFIARYYKNLGDKGNARVYYSKAIQEAKNQNNQSLTTSLEQEAVESEQ